MTDDITRARAARVLPDVDAIAARAEAAPGGEWEAFPHQLWIPWAAPADEDPIGPWGWGRYLTVQENEWHDGSEALPAEAWEFIAGARGDVLALAAEVRRLRAELATVRKVAA